MNWPRQVCAVVIGLGSFLAAAHGQYSFTDPNSIDSISGQFTVSSAPVETVFFRDPALFADTNAVHLDPALLAVAAERFKFSLRQQLGIAADASWSGKIYLRLHQARSLNEQVTITSSSFLDHWNYSVELPDVLSKTCYARALTAVLLLEFANRASHPAAVSPEAVHSAELPDWLVAGLAQQILAAEGEKVILSAPVKKADQLAVNRLNLAQRSFDPLAAARPILLSQPALTFDQLSWPTDAQMEGADGGAYLAAAQLFQFELLGLKDGKRKTCDMLQRLPAYMNWQTAFYLAFGDDFAHPLDVEKWWALRLVNFAERAPGPLWTVDVSLVRLDALLSVPVEFRSDSNAMPSHADISLQDALKNLDPAQREIMLRTKIRDFGLEELRLAPPYGNLADGYRVTLVDFLGEAEPTPQAPPANKRIIQNNVPQRAGLVDNPPLAGLSGQARSNTKTSVGNKPDLSVRGGSRNEVGSTTRTPVGNRHLVQNSNHRVSLAETLNRLDELDRRRREAEIKTTINLSGTSGAAPQ